MLQNASVNGPLMMYEKASGVVNETRYFEVLLRLTSRWHMLYCHLKEQNKNLDLTYEKQFQ